MSDYEPKDGDRVLVACEFLGDDQDKRFDIRFPGTVEVFDGGHVQLRYAYVQIHSHPGVSVASLVRECWLAGRAALSVAERNEYVRLRDAREAAEEPKLKKGWIKVTQRDLFVRGDGKVAVNIAAWDGGIRRDVEDALIFIHPDDIRTEKP